MTQTILSKQAVRFEAKSNKLLLTLEDPTVRPKRVASLSSTIPPQNFHLLSSGVLNMLWQEWNQFCRNYWMLFVYGGNLSNVASVQSIQTVAAISVNKNQPKTVYNFLAPTNGRYQRRFVKRVINDYEEPTWGTRIVLSEISSFYLNYYTEIANLAGGLNIMGSVLDHMQIVRNAAIHLNKSSCEKLRSVAPYYAISRNINYPTDFLLARELQTGKLAIQYWIDEITTLAQLMCN